MLDECVMSSFFPPYIFPPLPNSILTERERVRVQNVRKLSFSLFFVGAIFSLSTFFISLGMILIFFSKKKQAAQNFFACMENFP